MQKGISFTFFYISLLTFACFSLQAQNHYPSSQPYSLPESFMIENPEISVWQSDYYPADYYPLVLYFPIDKYLLKHDYHNNGMMLAALDEMLASDHIIENIDTIEILGACSPVGSPQYNHKLSYNRCLSLRSYLYREHPQIVEKFPVQMNYIGIDYLGYSILSKKKKRLSEKEKWNMLQYAAIRLKMKDGSYITPGKHNLKPNIQPEANIAINNTGCLKPDTVYVRDTIVVVHIPEQTPPPAIPKRPIFYALKSNLLYDAALLPNLSAEIYLGKQWSLVAEANWSWWKVGSSVQNQWYHRIQVAGIELRHWFKSPNPLHGHALGAYGMMGDYDIRFFPKSEISIGELSYGSWSTGLSYAYSFPIARSFNLEFGLAAGYVGGRYYKYDYSMAYEHWRRQTVYNRSYIGPTRVGISLVWLPNRSNSNLKNK